MAVGTYARIALGTMLMSVAVFCQEQQSGLDLSGNWANLIHQEPLRTASGMLGEYGGVPINEAGRLSALAWNASRMTVRQQQCAAYVTPYLMFTGGSQRFWEERDPHTQKLIAIKMFGQITEGNRTIWMDGRPYPPAYAQHTWTGFSTGKYEGNALTVFTTHIKRGWLRGNGLPESDEATLVEHFIRHGDRITYVFTIHDPVYLAEPFIRTSDMVRDIRDPESWLYACDDAEQILDKSNDRVPAYFWGQHPFLQEYSKKYNIPLLAALGGPETMYPEFKLKIKGMDPPAAETAAKAKLSPAPGPQHTRRATDPDPHDGEIHVLHVQGNVYMLVGDGGNIAVEVGDQGPLVVDTGTGRLSAKAIAAIRKLSDQPIQFIVNTSFHSDHTGGNVALRAAGEDPSLFGSFFSGQFADAGRGATIIAHQNVQNRMSQQATIAAEGWPSDTFLSGRRRKNHNGEAVEIFWEPKAISDGDSIVHFRNSDVIVTGDIFATTQYPFIDIKNGGSIKGEIDALNDILEKTVYEHEEEGGTLIVPGHGRLCDEYDVSEYRDMLVIIRDRVQEMIDRGSGLEQIKAARVTVDYDDLYGATSGPWTTDMFVEAVYAGLKRK